MKIIEMLNSLPVCQALAAEKALSPRAKFMVSRNIAEMNKALQDYDAQKHALIEELKVSLVPYPENPDMSKLVFDSKEQEDKFYEMHKPLLETDVKLPHCIASLEVISFVAAADLTALGDFITLSDLEA